MVDISGSSQLYTNVMHRKYTLLLLALTLVSCKPPRPTLPGGPPLVEVAKPLKRDVPIVAEGIAQTEATANVEVRARVEATVEKILFVEGSEVKVSDPLFLLDKKPIEQRLAAVKGNLGQLEASLGRANQDVARLLPMARTSGSFCRVRSAWGANASQRRRWCSWVESFD